MVIGYPPERGCTEYLYGIQIPIGTIGSVQGKVGGVRKGQTMDPTGECNLTYMKVAMWEPIVDTARLISPNGIAAITDDHVNRSVQWMERAIRWPEVKSSCSPGTSDYT